MKVEINLASSAGFCFGVKRAINIARESARKYPRIEMLGDIVHNDNVVKDIKQMGIKRIDRLCQGKGKALLIRAHGIPKHKVIKAKSLGYKIIDATCPMVKEIHKIAGDFEKKGYKIIVIGDKKHAEVQGIIGNIKTKSLVIDNLDDLRLGKIKRIKKAAVVVQSTQNLDKVNLILSFLKDNIGQIVFRNTICETTRRKQDQIKQLPLYNDIMVIIGSKKSANTKRLYQISKDYNQNTYWVQSAEDLKKSWFKAIKKVGLTAGASTPDYTIKQVIQKIRQINRDTSPLW